MGVNPTDHPPPRHTKLCTERRGYAKERKAFTFVNVPWFHGYCKRFLAFFAGRQIETVMIETEASRFPPRQGLL
jgi:hypothetical protein